jgi:hypothetical protein
MESPSEIAAEWRSMIMGNKLKGRRAEFDVAKKANTIKRIFHKVALMVVHFCFQAILRGEREPHATARNRAHTPHAPTHAWAVNFLCAAI